MASTNIDTGSAGVINAAIINMTTNAYLRPLRNRVRDTIPNLESAKTIDGNSKTKPMSRTIELNIDI